MAIYLCGSTKGGVGKSTTAVNLGAALTLLKRRVRLVDADVQAHTTAWVTLRRRDPVLQQMQLAHAFGDVRDLILGYQEGVDDVVVDAHGADCRELRTALEAADIVLLPFKVSQFDLWALEPICDVLTKARVFNPALRALAFINEAPTNWTERGDIDEARAAILTCADVLDLAQTDIHRLKPFKRTIKSGRAVFEVGRTGYAASDEFWNLFHEAQERLERRPDGRVSAPAASIA